MEKSYKRLRREAFLKAWPVSEQLEAMQDRDAGNTTKWDRMQADFQAIRQQYPSASRS